MLDKNQSCADRVVQVTQADLPLSCPRKDQPLWNAHPRVFLPIEKHGYAACPYCGTQYKLAGVGGAAD